MYDDSKLSSYFSQKTRARICFWMFILFMKRSHIRRPKYIRKVTHFLEKTLTEKFSFTFVGFKYFLDGGETHLLFRIDNIHLYSRIV